MFGKHDWIKATGVVVAVDRQETQFVDGAAAQTVGGYVIDIHPEGAEVFRAQVWPGGFNVPGFHAESSHFQHPAEGQTVAVVYNPKNHEVHFDMSDPSNSKPGMHDRNVEAHAAFERAMSGAPGSTAPTASQAGGLPEGLGQLIQSSARQGGVRVVDMSGGEQGAVAADPVERLTKLAKLKEMGLVDDAQFAELRARILSDS